MLEILYLNRKNCFLWKKKKKKKLTLGVSSKTLHNVPNYVKSSKKTSVLIEKQAPRRWGGKKFQSRDNNISERESTDSFVPKKHQ